MAVDDVLDLPKRRHVGQRQKECEVVGFKCKEGRTLSYI